MEYYLLRHGHVNEAAAMDPYTAPLSAAGVVEARALAEACVGWGVEFLCVSTAVRAEQTADFIQQRLPDVLRWDLKELESLSVDDMEGQVIFSSNPKRWTSAQYRYGIERSWVRLVAALARIEIYASAWKLERIALVTHPDIINLCLYNWL
ncbi:MAG: histidine phosphatase family protein, partial [Chloroflexi bacterium]|nr:histidine phosphatase family protein [Chloroflexota bacterium]